MEDTTRCSDPFDAIDGQERRALHSCVKLDALDCIYLHLWSAGIDRIKTELIVSARFGLLGSRSATH